MADWSLPSLTSTYSDFLTFLKARDDDSATMFSGTPTNIPTNAVKWNSTSNLFEKWNGTTWSTLTTNLMMNTNSIYNSAIVAGATINDAGAAATNILWTSSKINSFAAGYVTTASLSTTLSHYLLKNGENGVLTLGTNDASAVNIETANVNRLSVSGTGNITIAAPSAGVALTITPFAGSNAITSTGTLQGDRLVSTIAQGTAPLTVTSTTKVTNLNADLLDDMTATTTATANSIVARDGTGGTMLNNLNITNGLADGGEVTFDSLGNTSINIDNSGGTLRVFDSGELFKVSSSTGNIWAKGSADLGGGTRTPWVELGSQDTNAETPFIDFHSGITATDYDSRIIASGGTTSSGGGTLTFQAASCTFPSANVTAVMYNSSRANELSAAASYIYDTGDGWMRKKTLANVQAEVVTTAAILAAGGATLGSPTFTGTVVLPSTTSIGTITNTELSYLDGVTSGIQGQFTGKQPALGFTPVQQGTGIGQLGNTVKIGWNGYGTKITVDTSDMGTIWSGQPSATSFSTNGYQILPSGIILQWGRSGRIAQGTPFLFPIAFPNYCFSLVGSYDQITSNTLGYSVGFGSVNSLGFIYRMSYGVNGFSWFAIGY